MKIPFLGDLLSKVADKGGDIIKELVRDKDLAEKLDHEFRTLLSTQNHDIEKMVLQVESDMFKAQQETIQAELHQTDLYTKRSRPKIARRSFYAGLIYMLLTALPEGGVQIGTAVMMPWQFRWEVLLLAYSPALTYMGVRGFEKWKAGGAKS